MSKLEVHQRKVRIGVFVVVLLAAACAKKGSETIDTAAGPASKPSSQMSASQIIDRYRSLDNSHDSTIKLRAQITGGEDSPELNTPRQIQLTLYRKREPDSRLLILVEFTSPPEERDRDGLITVFPDGRIEAVRYVQSTDSFLVATEATSEDALFGLTPQELADGQPEKYDFTLIGEEKYEGTQVYRLQGQLKQGAESKFPRLVLLISKQDFGALEAEFYDNHGELARRLVVSKAEPIAGHWSRMRWTIDNLSRRKKIDFEATEVKYDQNLSDSLFTRENLKKIASR